MAPQKPKEIRAIAAIVLVSSRREREALAGMINSIGVPFAIATNGHDAYDLLSQGAKQTLITDRLFPPWPGLGNLRDVKQWHGELRIVLVSGYRYPAAIIPELAGADVVLRPPIRVQELRTALKHRPLS